MNNRLRNIIEKNININKIKKWELYEKKGGDKTIIELLKLKESLTNRSWGDILENIISEDLNCGKSDNMEYDLIYNNKYKIEVKCSSMLNKDLINDKKTYQYTDIRKNYNYDYILFCNIELKSIEYYIIKKEDLFNLTFFKKQKMYKKNKVIKMINFDYIKDYVVRIKNEVELVGFIFNDCKKKNVIEEIKEYFNKLN